MPSGATHDRITLWGLPWVVGLSYGTTINGELTLVVAGGYLFSGLMFGPDLDIYSVQFKRWGYLRWLWLPYRHLMSHRSVLSHGFMIGTVVRVLYLGLWLGLFSIVVVAIAQILWGFTWNWQQFLIKILDGITARYWPMVVAMFVGLELGSMSHYGADWIVSKYKKNSPKKRKRRRKKN
jgi:uncharacterized metal-binding protein